MYSMPVSVRIIHFFRYLLSFILISTFMLSCGITPAKIKKSEIKPFRVINSTISKDVKDTGSRIEAISPSREFTPEDKIVVSHLGFAHLTGRHQIRWEWYTPDGTLYQTTGEHSLKAPDGEYIEDGSTYHDIDLKGKDAASHPGNGRLKFT